MSDSTYGTPKRLQEAATSYGGTNLYGEPRYRVVLGEKRFVWKYTPASYDEYGARTGGAAVRLVHKYSPKNRHRYHVEKWLPAEHYGTPESWHLETSKFIDGVEVDTLGPYPSRGEYETLWTFETPDGQYLEPTKDLLITAIKRNQWATARRVDDEIIERRREDALAAKTKGSQNRDVMRQLTKEFIDKALPGRTVKQLKEELTAPRG